MHNSALKDAKFLVNSNQKPSNRYILLIIY